MRVLVFLVVLGLSHNVLKAEMFIQTSQGKEFADLVRSAFDDNDTVNPEIEAEIISAQKQIAAMGRAADRRLIQMVAEWLSLDEQGQLSTIKGTVHPSVALALVSHDPDAGGPLLGPLVGWMDRLADGKIQDQGYLPQKVAMFIALWGGETEKQHLQNDVDKLLASSAYGAHSTGIEIREALDGHPSGPRIFRDFRSTLSQWCQRQIDYRNDFKAGLLRKQKAQMEQNEAPRPLTSAPLPQKVQAMPQLVAASSAKHLWWLWTGGIAAALVVIYITIKKSICR